MNPTEQIKERAGRVAQFYRDVRGEMKKVSWPARQEVFGTTLVVIVSVFFFGFYLWVVDSLLQNGLKWVLDHLKTGG